MKKNAQVAAGTAALAILLAGGVALAIPAQASTPSTSAATSVVEPSDAGGTDSDNVQDEAGDGADTGNAVEDGSEDCSEDGREDGSIDGETADDTGTENTGDDVNGVAVEDGIQD